MVVVYPNIFITTYIFIPIDSTVTNLLDNIITRQNRSLYKIIRKKILKRKIEHPSSLLYSFVGVLSHKRKIFFLTGRGYHKNIRTLN